MEITTPNNLKFSVLIITHNRAQLLANCLESLKKSLAAIPKEDYEVIVFYNATDRSELSFVEDLGIANLSILESKDHLSPAAARNRAIEHAKKDYICFLDDDTLIPEDYFHTALSSLKKNNFPATLGGVELLYPNYSDFEQSLQFTISCPLTTAHTVYRHTTLKPKMNQSVHENHLILCNLWIKREIFSEYKFSFPEKFKRCEENYLLEELNHAGFFFCREPSLKVFHKKKSNWKDLFNAVFKSGYYRVQVIRDFPRWGQLIYFVPAMFLVFLLLARLLPTQLVTATLAIYTFLVLVFLSGKVLIQTQSLKVSLLSTLQAAFIHFSYALGSIFGVIVLLLPLLLKRLPQFFQRPRTLSRNDHSQV